MTMGKGTRQSTLRWGVFIFFVLASSVPMAEEAHPGITKLKVVKAVYPRDVEVSLSGMVDVQNRFPDDVIVDLKYASTDNFMGVDVYGGL